MNYNRKGGEKGLFQQWQPHFIWMDVRMPVMDRLQAAGSIKDTVSGKSTIIAAFASHALEDEKEQIPAVNWYFVGYTEHNASPRASPSCASGLYSYRW